MRGDGATTRRGKALQRFYAKGFVEACRLVGMTDDEIRAKLEELLKPKQGSE